MKAFLALLHARNLEFVRDRSALGWNLAFPFMLVIGFAILFGDDKPVYKIGILGSSQQLEALHPDIAGTRYVERIYFDDSAKAEKKIAQHQIDLLMKPGESIHYWINDTSPNGYLLERLLQGIEKNRTLHREIIHGEEVRYVDWALPGILGINIMFSCLFGIGYVIVRYRKNGYLRRLKATPLSAMQFLLAQLISRLLLIQAITLIVFICCNWLLDFNMQGSYLLLFLVSVLGSICMISLGLLVASRLRSEELAGGLLNLATWPMMLLSGVWFSLEGSPQWLVYAAQALPLTHMVDAARAIMTEGATLMEIMPSMGIMAIMTLIFLTISASIFRWE